MNDPLDSAIPVGSGPGTTVPPPTPPPPATGAVPPPTMQPQAAPSGNEKLWAILSHVSAYLGVALLLPLVVYLAMREDSPFAAGNAKEALNFHLSLLIYALCCIPLVLIVIGIPLLVIMSLGALVLSIVAAFRASKGESYRYPLTIRLVS